MRIFLLENAEKGKVVRAIVCAPDASGGVESDRAISFNSPDGHEIVLRQSGESEFLVTEDQTGHRTENLEAAVVREAENSLTLDVVYSAGPEVSAFSFLDEHHRVSVRKVAVQIGKCFDGSLAEVWSFQANLALLREYEMRLRTESIVGSLVQRPSELEANRYTDELSRAASSVELGPDLFLPLQCEINNTTVACVVYIQGINAPDNFTADVYLCDSDLATTEIIELMNVNGETLLIATVL